VPSRVDLGPALGAVRARVDAAAVRAGRDPGAVRLIAVSKTRPPDDVRAAWDAGQIAFGENYAQELRDKSRALGPGIEWHFIGPLQRNKVKYVVGTAALVHTVESLALAEEIDRRAGALGLVQPVLVEVNVAREPQKHGVDPDGLGALLAGVRKLPHVAPKGLMTMAPLGAEPEAARAPFRALAALARTHGLPELSMGMSQDFEVAIEEGATLVRVGTAIFGER
jgi:pyridoxal phosphate enzyme (YggS family)